MRSHSRQALAALTTLTVCATPALMPAAVAAVDPDAAVVINEVYGGGGNSGAVYSHDFIELRNTGTETVDVDGWSVQYAAAAGTNWSGSIPLTGSIEPGELYVVQAGTNNASVGDPLPVTPDATGSMNLAAANGNVALASTTTRLACTTTACASDADVVDLVGFGTGAAYAGSGAAPAPSSSTSVARDAGGTNTGDNAADFTAGDPTPGVLAGGGSGPGPDPDPDPGPDPDFEPVSIREIQGTGDVSPVVGDAVVVRGVVTAAYSTGGYFGFVLQTPGTGGELDELPVGSDAVFVYQQTGTVVPRAGDHVEVRGTVAEFNGLTQVVAPDASAVDALSEPADPVEPVTGIGWPTTDAEREVLESMLFLPVGDYTVSNTYSTNQYGEVGLAFGDRPLLQPTEIARPLSAEALAVEADNAARAVTLDDGASTNFLSTANSAHTPPYISLTTPVRVGAAVEFAEPVIVDFRNDAWKFQPTYHLTADDQTLVAFEDTRTDAPDAERLGDGALQVAGFNVLNYFTTLGVDVAACVPYTDRDGNGVTVRTGCDPRGAWDEQNFERQQSKIVDAITALDTDVVGLMETENSLVVTGEDDAAVADLVQALNDAAGEERWAYVTSSDELPPVAEMDVITNAILYQPATVQPVGQMRALGHLSGDGEPFSNAREPIGQAFVPVAPVAPTASAGHAAQAEPFFVVVNHFKSKGSGTGANADQGDGQGASNLDRVRQATALVEWLDQVVTEYDDATGAMDTFVVGDLNSYSQEDPMQVLADAGYVNTAVWMAERGFAREFSYSFSGLSGSLDHVLVNAEMLEEDRVTGADVWEINAPESIALEYSRFNYHGTLFHEPGPFRSSDHDPVIVAFDARTAQGPEQPEEPEGPEPDEPGPTQPSTWVGKLLALLKKLLDLLRGGG